MLCYKIITFNSMMSTLVHSLDVMATPIILKMTVHLSYTCMAHAVSMPGKASGFLGECDSFHFKH